jgi:gliding motility-associated-like protein
MKLLIEFPDLARNISLYWLWQIQMKKCDRMVHLPAIDCILFFRIQIALTVLVFFITGQALLPQSTDRISRNNYTGDWETASSWEPAWASPQTTIYGYDVEINGYITVNGPLTFTGSFTDLTINDTLVVKGDLTLGNNNFLTVIDNAILIIWGNLTFHDNSIVAGNSIMVVWGDVIKTGSENLGSFTSNDDPVRLYIGGTVAPEISGDPNYPVLNCSDSPTDPYINSGCSFGNMTDITSDPIFDFFQSTCSVLGITSNSPLCSGNAISINLTATEAISYSWHGPGGFTSDEQNPEIPGADADNAGIYTVTVTAQFGCTSSGSTRVIIDPLPLVSMTGDNSMCINDQVVLEGIPAGGTFVVTGGQGSISDNTLSASGAGEIFVEYHYTGACSNMAEKAIRVHDYPVVNAGWDKELTFIFNVRMQATLLPFETGEWSLVSGSGRIQDTRSPATVVNGLSLGDNIFLWTVQNESCEASKEVKFTVRDLFIPSAISPNNDDNNDFFRIARVEGRVELIIFNRWGLIEYQNNNYINNWDGRNRSGVVLPNDTYFYILKFENGITKKGTILVKR